MPTNGELLQEITGLKARMDGLDARMTTYENQAREQTVLLKEVKAGVEFLKGAFRFIKWAGIAIVSAALWQVGTLVFHLIFH